MSALGLDIGPLRIEDTVQVDRVGHRLAMGVQWIDALSGQFPGGSWRSQLSAIGVRPLPLTFDIHPMGRHALRAAGRVAKLLAAGAADKAASPPATPDLDQTNFVLRAYGSTNPAIFDYATGSDPRQYVPRRLSLTPMQSAGWPTATAGNIRTAWLWPGATYPIPSNATVIRGRVQRGTSLSTATPIVWTRIIVTGVPDPSPNPLPAPNFATEKRVGYAHGDDRGEFLVVLGPAAALGGTDLTKLYLRVWAFLPPADLFDAKNPLASLPLEVTGTATASDLLRGTQPPTTYVAKPAVVLPALAPGTVFTMDETTLLFV